MSTTTGDAVADRQRQRAARSLTTSRGTRTVEPPRERRPALAIRMDSRVEVLAAARDIAPGTRITAADLTKVPVASEGLELIGAEHAEVIIGAYATSAIPANMLIDERLLSKAPPVGDNRAIVQIVLQPNLTPSEEIRSGDVVTVIRADGEAAPKELGEGLVLSVVQGAEGDLAATSGATVSMLVPRGIQAEVVDASRADAAGVAIVARGKDVTEPLGSGE